MDAQYQQITENEIDLACQKFVEKEFPKAVKAVNRFSGKSNPQPKKQGELNV